MPLNVQDPYVVLFQYMLSKHTLVDIIEDDAFVTVLDSKDAHFDDEHFHNICEVLTDMFHDEFSM